MRRGAEPGQGRESVRGMARRGEVVEEWEGEEGEGEDCG